MFSHFAEISSTFHFICISDSIRVKKKFCIWLNEQMFG